MANGFSMPFKRGRSGACDIAALKSGWNSAEWYFSKTESPVSVAACFQSPKNNVFFSHTQFCKTCPLSVEISVSVQSN